MSCREACRCDGPSQGYGDFLRGPLPTPAREPVTIVDPVPQADHACSCGGSLTSYVHDTGDGWSWGWECAECGPEEWYGDAPFPWPFGAAEAATGNDWLRAGVGTVV